MVALIGRFGPVPLISVSIHNRLLKRRENNFQTIYKWLQLFKRWIALSTRQITIKPISIMETNCVIYSRDIHSMNGVIHRLNNWGLIYLRKTNKSNNHSVTRCPRALASWAHLHLGQKLSFRMVQRMIFFPMGFKTTSCAT